MNKRASENQRIGEDEGAENRHSALVDASNFFNIMTKSLPALNKLTLRPKSASDCKYRDRQKSARFMCK